MKPQNRIAFARSAPLPVRQGIAPSRVFLAPGPWSTIGQFLEQRFPHVPLQALLQRLERADIVDQQGQPQFADTPYVPGGWLWYYRDVPDEVKVPFDLPVLYRDDYLVVVDKPHFLASVPGGRYLQETALSRLRDQLDLPLLTPLHRLDRDTAGVLMFCAHPPSRGAYQALFQSRQVFKEYQAVAPLSTTLHLPVRHCSRLEQKHGHFTMMETAGPPNSETRVELLRSAGSLGLYRLLPLTGRKHQLRVHMASLGIPIVNDLFYPTLQAMPAADDFSRPLQLLARTVQFVDPVTGTQRCFVSQRRLGCLD